MGLWKAAGTPEKVLRKLLWGLGLSSLWALPVQAQTPSLDLSAFQGARGHYELGFSWLDSAAFNNALESDGFAPLSGTFIRQGGGVEVLLERVLVGASGYALNGFQTANSTGDSFAVNGGYGVFKLGYLVIQEPGFSLYPVMGIGSGSLNVSSSRALNQIFSFAGDEVFQMQTPQIVLDLGVGADYMIDFNGDPSQDSGVNLGLRLGYAWVPSPQQWRSGQRLLAGQVPNMSVQGPYLQLSLGGGTQSSRTGSRRNF